MKYPRAISTSELDEEDFQAIMSAEIPKKLQYSLSERPDLGPKQLAWCNQWLNGRVTSQYDWRPEHVIEMSNRAHEYLVARGKLHFSYDRDFTGARLCKSSQDAGE